MDITDSRGNALQVGDDIAFISWGFNVALSDTQGTSKVVGFGRTRVRVAIGGKTMTKAVRPSMVVKVVDGKAAGKPKPLR